MAHITRFPFLGHLRSEPNQHVLHFRRGKCVRSQRGATFLFVPSSSAIAEVPCDDREQPFLFHGRTSDFQDVTTQGIVTYRVVNAETLAARINFSIDTRSGQYRETPLEQIAQLVTQLAQQIAWEYVAKSPLRQVLSDGVDEIRTKIREGLTTDSGLQGMGLEIVSVRVASVSPQAEVEKALQTPMRETIRQEADEAVFQRRALAVENERAIKENELQSEIELARREQKLITEQGRNDKQREVEAAAAEQVKAESTAERRLLEARAAAQQKQLKSTADAEAIAAIEGARVSAESDRINIYRDLPSRVLAGLAARELAGKFDRIEHLNITPDMLGTSLQSLLRAGAEHLTGAEE